MGGRLILQGAEACDLAIRLAALTGESVADAVTKALRAELERRERARDIEAKVARMMAIAGEIRTRLRGPGSSDTSDFYDENGLPK